MAVVPCPSCNDLVRFPTAGVPAEADVQCPWCSITLPSEHWSRKLPPVAIVHPPKDRQNDRTDPPPTEFSQANPDSLPDASLGDDAADPDETVGDLSVLTPSQAKTTLIEDELHALSDPPNADPPNAETVRTRSDFLDLMEPLPTALDRPSALFDRPHDEGVFAGPVNQIARPPAQQSHDDDAALLATQSAGQKRRQWRHLVKIAAPSLLAVPIIVGFGWLAAKSLGLDFKPSRPVVQSGPVGDDFQANVLSLGNQPPASEPIEIKSAPTEATSTFDQAASTSSPSIDESLRELAETMPPVSTDQQRSAPTAIDIAEQNELKRPGESRRQDSEPTDQRSRPNGQDLTPSLLVFPSQPISVDQVASNEPVKQASAEIDSSQPAANEVMSAESEQPSTELSLDDPKVAEPAAVIPSAPDVAETTAKEVKEPIELVEACDRAIENIQKLERFLQTDRSADKKIAGLAFRFRELSGLAMHDSAGESHSVTRVLERLAESPVTSDLAPLCHQWFQRHSESDAGILLIGKLDRSSSASAIKFANGTSIPVLPETSVEQTENPTDSSPPDRVVALGRIIPSDSGSVVKIIAVQPVSALTDRLAQ